LSPQRIEQNHREHLAEAALMQAHSGERLKQYAQQLDRLEKAVGELMVGDRPVSEQIGVALIAVARKLTELLNFLLEIPNFQLVD
jgi:hypothetical protein